MDANTFSTDNSDFPANNKPISKINDTQQPLNIANALQDSPIKLLLGAGISEFTIQTLAQVFGVEYVEQNHQDMIARWNESKQLVDEINRHDKAKSSHFYKIVVTEGFMQESFNTQLREHNVDKLPWISHTNNTILVDLFSQGRADLLNMRLDIHPRNADIAKTHSVNPYLFNPAQLLYVDLHNHDWQKTCAREGGDQVIPQYYVQSDALQFISLLPDNSVSYVISGFDDYVIKSYITLGGQYLDALNKELLRTTKPQGVIAGINYERRDILKKLGFATLFEISAHSDGFYCHQKS